MTTSQFPVRCHFLQDASISALSVVILMVTTAPFAAPLLRRFFRRLGNFHVLLCPHHHGSNQPLVPHQQRTELGFGGPKGGHCFGCAQMVFLFEFKIEDCPSFRAPPPA